MACMYVEHTMTGCVDFGTTGPDSREHSELHAAALSVDQLSRNGIVGVKRLLWIPGRL